MKVMFAVPSYWPSQDGVANITKYLAEGLASKGHKVYIFTSTGNGGLQELPEHERHQGVEIERMRVYVRWPLCMKGRNENSTRKTYLRRIQEIKPDILVVVCAQTWTLDWIKNSLEDIECKKVFYSHGYSWLKEKYDYRKPLKNKNIVGVLEILKIKKYYNSLHKYVSKFDKAIYLTQENNSMQYALKHNLNNGIVISNAIEDCFYEEQNQHDYAEDRPIVQFLFVANYSENKNQEMLLKAFANADIGKSRLVFIGFEENAYLDSLRKLQEELAIENEKEVLFEVHMERQKIIKTYKESDVFVCPSKSETWSIVAHEAAAVGIPIISTDVGIYGEIDGACIVNSQEEMQRAIEVLYADKELRKAKGVSAREWLLRQNCSVNDKVLQLEAELQQLLI